MALKAVLLNLDEVEDAIRALYSAQKVKDKDGKDIDAFVLDIEGLDESVVLPHPVVRNLRTAHERTKREKAALAAKLAEAEEKTKVLPEGFDPEEYTKLKALEADFEANKDKSKDQKIEFDNMRRMHEEQKRKIVEDKDKEIIKIKGERDNAILANHNLVRQHDLERGLTTVGIKTEDREVVAAYLMPRISVEVDDSGAIKTYIDGAPTSEFLTAWANSDRGRRYVEPLRGSDARSGSGGPGTGENPWSEKQWNLTKQQDFLRTNPNRAKQLMAAAGFETQEQAIAASVTRRASLTKPPTVLSPPSNVPLT